MAQYLIFTNVYSKVKNIRKFQCKYMRGTRLKILFMCLIIYCLLLIIYNYIGMHYKNKFCHDELIENGVPDIINEIESPPPKGKSIFFHETSCNFAGDKIISITPRQACAVESAAKLNPNTSVYLLYTSPIRFPNTSTISSSKYRILNELLKYDNVKIRRVYLGTYIKNTPLEKWYESGELKASYYMNSHTSDVLRYLSLWKYGGTYLDLDVVVMKNLENLPPNYAGAEDKYDVAAGVINLDYENEGHYLAGLCLKELSTNFRGDKWGHNGPGVITRVLQRVCKIEKTSLMKPHRCKGFTVYKQSYFYPIYWDNWRLFFDPSRLVMAFNIIRKSYIIHVWNKFSSETNILTREKDVAYGAMARTHCPNVYRESGDVF